MISIQDQVSTLLTSEVAESKVAGNPVPDVEAASVLENLAVSLSVRPKAVIYIAHLARNALVRAAKDEIAEIDSLTAIVRDLGNVSYAVSNTASLESAKASLLQMGSQARVDSSSVAFKKFDKSVSEFLNKQLKKNVARSGSTDLVRPSDEAVGALPGAMAALVSLHEDTLSRLYSLAVGVDNFLSVPLGGIFGTAASARVYRDIQNIIDSLEEDTSAASSRDVAVRLIAARASLKVLGSSPNLYAPILDTDTRVPPGYAVSLYTPSIPITVTASVSGVPLPPGGGIIVSVGSETVSVPLLLQPGLDFSEKSVMVGSPAVYPVTIPSGADLYVSLTGLSGGVSTVRIQLNTSESDIAASMEDVIEKINSSGYEVRAARYMGGDRIALYAPSNSVKALTLVRSFVEYTAATWATDHGMAVYSSPANHLLGFSDSQSSSTTNFQELAREAIREKFSGVVSIPEDGPFTISSLASGPGVTMTLSGEVAEWLGVSGTFSAKTRYASLRGTVNGKSMDPVNPVPVLSVGDILSVGGESASILSMTSTGVVLSSEIPLYDGPVTARSPLDGMWSVLRQMVRESADAMLASSYRDNLARLDRAVAPLYGSPTAAHRNQVTSELRHLRDLLTNLISRVTSSGTSMDPAWGISERSVVDGVTASLRERKFDRALYYLLRCSIREVFSMDWQSASFSGELMRSMAELAANDVVFPNHANDEGSTITVNRSR